MDSEDKTEQMSPCNLDGTTANSPEKPDDDKGMVSGEKSSSPIDVEIENIDEENFENQPVKNNENTVENIEKDSNSINKNDVQENG